MNIRRKNHQTGKSQRGSVIVIVAICLFLLIGLAALAIDIGYMLNTRSELQNVADSAALAGARYLGAKYADLPASDMATYPFTKDEVWLVIESVANQNKAANKSISIEKEDVRIGFWDPEKSTKDIWFETLEGPDAVRVIARRRDGAVNGKINTFLGRIFKDDDKRGTVGSDMAIAALTGPSTIEEEKLTTPFGLSQQLFDNDVCTDWIYFNPSASCAGWHNFIWPHSASNMSTIAMGIIKRHVYDPADSESPELSSGETWLPANFPALDMDKLDKDLDKILADEPVPEIYETGEYFDFQGGPITALFNGSYLVDYNGDTGIVEGTPENAPAPFFTLFDYFRYRDEDGDNSKWTAIVPVYKELEPCQTASGLTEIIGFARVEILMPYGPPDKTINAIVNCELEVVNGRGSGITYGNLKGTIPNLVK